MKKYKVIIISQNVYEKQVMALSEENAYNLAIETLSDDDKIAEECFDVEEIEEVTL
jgi:methionine synthase I (cobalamin-dependent)